MLTLIFGLSLFIMNLGSLALTQVPFVRKTEIQLFTCNIQVAPLFQRPNERRINFVQDNDYNRFYLFFFSSSLDMIVV